MTAASWVLNPPPPTWRERLAIAAGSTLDRLWGRDSGRHLEQVERMAQWDGERYAAYQDQRLAALLGHCHEQVSFYRRRLDSAGLEAGDLAAGRHALRQLPPLTKDDLRQAGAELRADNAGKLRGASTSGSSGQPLVMWKDLRTIAWSRTVQRRAFRWFGVEPHAPRVLLLSAPLRGRGRWRHRLVDLLTGRRLFEFQDLGAAQLERVADFLERYRPTFLTAYPSVLHELALDCQRRGRSLAGIGLRLLHCQSEQLLEVHRHAFAEVFGEVPVLDEYGCVEVGAMAYSCPRGTLHISHEHVRLEVVDEAFAPLPEGHSGRILLTPLESYGVPLLRYDLGDRGTLSTAPCACGRMAGAAVLASLDGRVFERIAGRSPGARWNAGIVHFLIRQAFPPGAVAEYLAEQRRAGELHFLLVPGAGFTSEQLDRLARAGRELFGAQVRISTEVVAAISGRRGRKRSYFQSYLTDSEEAVGGSSEEA